MVFKAPRRVAAAMAAALLTLTLAACASTEASTDDDSAAGSGGEEVTLSLVAYSTPQAAYEKIIAAFQKTDAGKNVKFTQSYGASGDQSRAVEAGLPADFVMFSLEPDMTRLVEAGMVDAAWNTDEHKGMITDSVVALVTRKGNPEGIKGWDDLTKKGIEVITPNPFSSGGARWNVMAGYGAQIEDGKSEAEAEQYLADLLANVPVQDDSARAALQTFTGGKGDVLHRLRERGDLRPAERRGPRLRRARLDDPDREPGRGHQQHQAPEGGQGVPRLRPRRGGAEDLRGERLPAGGRGRRHGGPGLPGAARPVHHRRPRRLGRGARRSSSTRRTASSPRSSATSASRRRSDDFLTTTASRDWRRREPPP